MNTMNNMEIKKVMINYKIVISFLLTLMLCACNTIAGMGKDIQRTAEYTSTMMPEKGNK